VTYADVRLTVSNNEYQGLRRGFMDEGEGKEWPDSDGQCNNARRYIPQYIQHIQ